MPPKVKFSHKLDSLQQEIMDYMDGKYKNDRGENYRFFIPVLGRQSGKSFVAKAALIEHAANRGHICMWVAPAIPTARDHWNDMVNLIEKSGMPVKKKNESAKEIHFYGGGIIYIRSAIEPNNLRGATLDLLVLDEAAYYRYGEYVWYGICLPMVTASRGIVLIPTTPNGRNWLYKLWKRGMGNDRYYKSWHRPSTEAPHQDKELLEDMRTSMPSHQWKTEFLAEFLADAGGCFAGVDKATTVPFEKAPVDGHSYVAGVDFGFSHDYTCITAIDKHTREQVYGKRFSNIGTSDTMNELIAFMDEWKPEIIHLEKNGIGETLFDMLKERIRKEINKEGDEGEENLEIFYNGTKVKALHMNNKIKRECVERLSADVEYGRTFLLTTKDEYGETQADEMSTYVRQRTASGMEVTYNAQEGSNDDTVSALYLANYGLPKIKKEKFDVYRGKPRPERKNPLKNRGNSARKHRLGKAYAKRR